jgi:hypothetical protein
MKKLFSITTAIMILMVSQVTISSCSKTVTNTDTITKTNIDTVTKIVTDTVTKVVTDTVTGHVITYPISNVLLGKQWIVDSLYENYNGSNPGTLVYVRGGSGNVQNLDNYIVILWPDNTQFFIVNGSNTTFTYSFQNSDSTELLLNNPTADYARIVNLTNTHLTIYDSTNSALSYYVYKP